MLISKILGRTEVGIHILIAVISNEGNILSVLLIQRNTNLHISVD